jgi:hypothetical protein
MRRVSRIVSILLVALVLSAFSSVPASAAGRTSVDPATLTPVPPPGATCWYTTNPHDVTCKTFKDFNADKQPVLSVACGTVYETSRDHRDGLRHYVNGLAVRRFVDEEMSGTWSLAPDGSGRIVRISSDWWSTSVWTTPGDDNTVHETFHGLQYRASAPGLGNAIFWYGTVHPDGTTVGIKNGIDAEGNLTPGAIAALSRVLC